MDDALAEHIRITAEKGLSRNEIKQLLLKAGWSEAQVNSYIERTFKTLEKGTVLRAQGVAKSFEQNKILEGIEFDVKNGEIFGIIGVSGAGKTTLLNILVGFLKPDQGDVLIAMPDGTTQSIFKNPELIKKNVGFSTQTPSFYNKLTVRENLEHFATLYHIAEPDLTRRCNALIELVGLKDARDTIAAHLSGGMQKRLDIACALLNDPMILVLDEPTADLDPILRKRFWELIKQINAKGTTILLASHFLAEIELLCSRIAILQNKKFIEIGTTQELRDIYSRNFEIFFETATQKYGKLLKELQNKRKYFSKITEEAGELVIQTPVPEQVLPIIASYVEKQKDIQSLHVARPTLGRVFEAIIKR